MKREQLEQILLDVQKPAQYIGGELNSVMKDKSKVDCRLAFCFPDKYEVGMSHLGMKIFIRCTICGKTGGASVCLHRMRIWNS